MICLGGFVRAVLSGGFCPEGFVLESMLCLRIDASVLPDLCGMSDDDFCGIFIAAQLEQLIIDISIN